MSTPSSAITATTPGSGTEAAIVPAEATSMRGARELPKICLRHLRAAGVVTADEQHERLEDLLHRHHVDEPAVEPALLVEDADFAEAAPAVQPLPARR